MQMCALVGVCVYVRSICDCMWVCICTLVEEVRTECRFSSSTLFDNTSLMGSTMEPVGPPCSYLVCLVLVECLFLWFCWVLEIEFKSSCFLDKHFLRGGDK